MSIAETIKLREYKMRESLTLLLKYMPRNEVLGLYMNCIDGSEQEFFREKIIETARIIKSAPPLGSQEALGDNAKVFLHYFGGASDIWITELDRETGEAYGYSCLTGDYLDAELGYVYIPEFRDSLELDLYWDDETTIGDVIKMARKRYFED